MRTPDPPPASIVGVINAGNLCRRNGCMLSEDGKPNHGCQTKGCPAHDYGDKEPVVQVAEEEDEPGD